MIHKTTIIFTLVLVASLVVGPFNNVISVVSHYFPGEMTSQKIETITQESSSETTQITAHVCDECSDTTGCQSVECSLTPCSSCYFIQSPKGKNSIDLAAVYLKTKQENGSINSQSSAPFRPPKS